MRDDHEDNLALRNMSHHASGFLERLPYAQSLALRGLSVDQYNDVLGLSMEAPSIETAHGHGHGFGFGHGGRLSYLSFHGHLGVCHYSFEPAFIRKRNERERQRVRCVNEGYARLREHLPRDLEDKRLSKVETLRAAIEYINRLQGLLEFTRSPGSGTAAAMEVAHGEARKNSCAAQRKTDLCGRDGGPPNLRPWGGYSPETSKTE